MIIKIFHFLSCSLLLCLLSVSVFSQTDEDSVGMVYAAMDVENLPLFPGCDSSAKDRFSCIQEVVVKTISEEFYYPGEAREFGIEGKINIVFVVEKDGSIGEIRRQNTIVNERLEALKKRNDLSELEKAEMTTLESAINALYEEAIRVVGLIPKAVKPGYMSGKPVRVRFMIPISARLN